MIVFAHLLNDRSGSPKVLATLVQHLAARGVAMELYVGSSSSGWLSQLPVPTLGYWYRRGSHRLITLLTYALSQCHLLLRLLLRRGVPGDAIVYVNTLLPFGAALYGRLTGRQVVYHVHEVSISPAPLRIVLVALARWTASHVIYVSQFTRQALLIEGVPATVVHNALDQPMLDRAAAAPVYQVRRDGVFRVVMLASLRDYKGIPEFVALARAFASRPDVEFHLVGNEEAAAAARYLGGFSLPQNLRVHGQTSDPAAFYERASVVVNLSRVDQWVETFGLTLLEAMAFGVPVIAPPAGGPREFVRDGVNGFMVDSRDQAVLVSCLTRLLDDEALCLQLSRQARATAGEFSAERFTTGILTALRPLQQGSDS